MAAQYSDDAAPLVNPAENSTSLPVICKISLPDLRDALRLGWEDFKAVPTHAFNLCMIYPLVGLGLARMVLGYSVLPLFFPLAAGFALLGPFAALGLYELSRRRERGEEPTVWNYVEVVRSPSMGAMLGLGTLLLALFVTWVAIAQAIYVAAFGHGAAAQIPDFVRRVYESARPVCQGDFVSRSDSGSRKILKPAISGNPSAASEDANVRTEAGTSLPITRSIAFV